MTEDWKIFFEFMENPTRTHAEQIDAREEEEERSASWQRATNPEGNWPTITRPKPVRGGMPDIPIHIPTPFVPCPCPCGCGPVNSHAYTYGGGKGPYKHGIEGVRVKGIVAPAKKLDARHRYEAVDDNGFMCKRAGQSKQVILEGPLHGPWLRELAPLPTLERKPQSINLAALRAKRELIKPKQSAPSFGLLHGPFLLELAPLPRTKQGRKGLHGPTLHTPE